MSKWQRIAAQAGVGIEVLIERLRRRRRYDGPVQLIGYRSMGTAAELLVSGRVLEDRGISEAAEELSRLQNLRDNWRRFGSRERAGVQVRASFQSQAVTGVTDEEG
jgi:hypothetical protein